MVMIGGFNTNIRYQGRIFHVQTEDSGRRNPKIVTLLYEGGVILTSRKSSYEEHVDAEELEDVVRELMEVQHRELVQALKDGELDEAVGIGEVTTPDFDGDGAKRAPAPSFGDGLISDRSLDQVIIDQLCQN